MIKKTRNKLITSLLLAAMVIPAFSINAQAAASAPMTTNYEGNTTYNKFGNWKMPNFTYDKDGNLCDSVEDIYSGKTDMTKTDPTVILTGEQRVANTLARKIYLVQKSTAEANNPALPFIKVSMNDFLCIYGPMYGDLGAKYESCYFDSARYAADYPDVVAAVGNTHAALWNHYKNSGIYEGRIGYVVNLYGETTNTANIYWDLAKVWTPQMTDREIVTWVNKWMCDNMTYNHGSIPGREQAEVCGGYAADFRTIMLNLGIPCELKCYGAGDTGHAWNLVYIEGQWKVVDVTWNDGDHEGGAEGPDTTAYLLVNSHPDDNKAKTDAGCELIFLTNNIYSVTDMLRNR